MPKQKNCKSEIASKGIGGGDGVEFLTVLIYRSSLKHLKNADDICK